MKKQRVYQDYDDDDNDYPLGTGQIDFEDFDYDMTSPMKQQKQQHQQQDKQQSLKKSDQTKPSTDKQNKNQNRKQSQYNNSNTSSVDVQIKGNQLISVESFNPITNEEKKKASKKNTNAFNSKQSSNHNSTNNFNSKNVFKNDKSNHSSQQKGNKKQQFEVQLVEKSYDEEHNKYNDDEDGEEESNQGTGNFYNNPHSTKNSKEKQSKDKNTKILQNNNDKSGKRDKSQENKQLSKHKKMILEDSVNNEEDNDSEEDNYYKGRGKQQQKNKLTMNKNTDKSASRSMSRQHVKNQSSKESSEEEEQIKPQKKQSSNNLKNNKPQRDDIKRKSSGPHEFKKAKDENHSSNEKKVNKQRQPQNHNSKNSKRRYGDYNDSDDSYFDNVQDQDIAMKNHNTYSSSDDEKPKKGKQNKNSSKNLGKKGTTQTENHQSKSPLTKNRIDFYQQDKQAPQTTLTKNSKQKKLMQDESKDESSESSVEIFSDDNGFSSNPISQNTSKRQAAKGFAKQKAQYEKDDDHDKDEEHQMDTNPENHLLEHKKKNRMSVKTENFFNLDYDQDEEPQPNEKYHLEEQGVAWAELNSLNEYFSKKKMKKVKRRRHRMKYIRARNLFFTSKWFMFFHLLQNVLFWMVVIVFPVISVIGCDGGHKWMSHVAMAFYLGLFLIFDFVFAFQYISSESDRFDLKGYSKNKTNRSGKCCHMLITWLYCIFEMIMTQVGLFDIYCDMAFATLVAKAGINDLAIVAFFSIGLIVIPKLYALIMNLLILFCQVREEDKKRKYASRFLLINEFRMQAANIDYVEYNKSKTDLWYGLYKFAFEDIPQFIIKVIFLTQYDCGRKYTNGIVYCGLLMALFNTYFGLLFRFARYCYSRKRLKSYQRKVEVKISNLDLAEYGFGHIRDNVHGNRKVQSFIFSGQNYEFMIIDQKNITKYEKFMKSFSKPERIEFFELNKVKFKSVRQEKQLLKAVDGSLKNLRYLTLQECDLCPNFRLQFKIFMDGNDSLARLSLIMNRMPEDDCYELLENCLEHPNLEIIQLAERNWKQVKIKEDIEDKDDKQQPMLPKQSPISICRGIQFRLQTNESLKSLEIRYLNLSRQILQAIFKGLQKNKKLQRLILTNDALKNATIADYQLLGESLKVNQGLLCLDLQDNLELEEKPEFHQEIINGVANNSGSTLKRICITTESFQIKADYLDLLEQKEDIIVFVGDKVLEDVDIQE